MKLFNTCAVVVFRVLIVNTLVLIALVLMLEVFSYVALFFFGNPQPLFINTTEGVQLPQDSLLTWTHSPHYISQLGLPYENGCVVLGCFDQCNPPPIKLLITGGSTSDMTFLPFNWPAKLHELFKKRNWNITIYNSAVMGYSSTQEATNIERRLIQQVKPDIILSHSGVNEDLSFRKMNNAVYFSDTDINNKFLPNLVGLLYFNLHKQTDGNTHLTEAELADRWLKNMSKINQIASDSNCGFLGILQPALGMGKYHLSEDERVFDNPRYYQEFYSILKPIATEKTYLCNMTDVFQNTNNVFLDDCHLDEKGNSILAEAILDTLLSRGLLTNEQFDLEVKN